MKGTTEVRSDHWNLYLCIKCEMEFLNLFLMIKKDHATFWSAWIDDAMNCLWRAESSIQLTIDRLWRESGLFDFLPSIVELSIFLFPYWVFLWLLEWVCTKIPQFLYIPILLFCLNESLDMTVHDMIKNDEPWCVDDSQFEEV